MDDSEAGRRVFHASQVRTGTGPHVMACLRNLASASSAGPGRSPSPPRCAITACRSGDTSRYVWTSARLVHPVKNGGAMRFVVSEER